MNVVIDDPNGVARAKVTTTGRLKTHSVNVSVQQNASAILEDVYQTSGSTTPNNDTTVPILLSNNEADKLLIVFGVRMQLIGTGGNYANTATKFELGTGLAYSSGGTANAIKNMNMGSTRSGSVTSYKEATTTGTFVAFDTYYPKEAGDLWNLREEGGLVVTPGSTIALRCTTDHTTGTACETRILYSLVDPDTL